LIGCRAADGNAAASERPISRTSDSTGRKLLALR
jgi:hypothetical protein